MLTPDQYPSVRLTCPLCLTRTPLKGQRAQTVLSEAYRSRPENLKAALSALTILMNWDEPLTLETILECGGQVEYYIVK